MSIEHKHHEYLLFCNEYCGMAGVFDSLDAAIGYAKSNGWRIRKIDGKWEHVCLECRGK